MTFLTTESWYRDAVAGQRVGLLLAFPRIHAPPTCTVSASTTPSAPRSFEAANYGRDGAMRFDGNRGAANNYEPNSFGGPTQTSAPLAFGIPVSGETGSHAPVCHAEDDDFVQAGALYRVMTEPERERLAADPSYGEQVSLAVKRLRVGG